MLNKLRYFPPGGKFLNKTSIYKYLESEIKILATLSEREIAIQKVMTPKLFEDLLKYGIYRLNSRFSIKYDPDRGFRGLMLEDLISEVLTSFIRPDGRNWNKMAFPDFKDQLISSYDSHICNTVNKEFKKASQTELIPEENDTLKDDTQNGEELGVVVMDILKDLGCSDNEILLFEPYYVNKMKREDVAKAFGKTVNDVTNIKKQLDRKLPKLRNELNKMKL